MIWTKPVTPGLLSVPFTYYEPTTAKPQSVWLGVQPEHETKLQAIVDFGCRCEVVRIRGKMFRLAIYDPLLRKDIISESVLEQEGEAEKAMNRMLSWFDPSWLHMARQLALADETGH